jgi:hypothetical protein
MINELYVQKLIRLINAGLITMDDIINAEYKAEAQSRLNAAKG